MSQSNDNVSLDEPRGHRVTEGFHRFKAIQTIQAIQEPVIHQKWQNFRIPANILPPMSHVQEMVHAYSLFLFVFICENVIK